MKRIFVFTFFGLVFCRLFMRNRLLRSIIGKRQMLRCQVKRTWIFS